MERMGELSRKGRKMKKYLYNPDYCSSPGETLIDLIEERQILPEKLAKLMNVNIDLVEELIIGNAIITPDIAELLEIALDVPAEFWLSREKHYRSYKENVK